MLTKLFSYYSYKTSFAYIICAAAKSEQAYHRVNRDIYKDLLCNFDIL